MRRAPQQQRSKQLVERIVAAGRSLLVAEGYDAFSTNRVAATAGISPGSLYQYFPDKAAILDVIVDRYWDEVAERVVASLGDRIGEVGPSATRAVVDALLTALEADAPLLRVLHDELPPRRLGDKLRALEHRVRQLTAAALAVQGTRDTAVRAWVVVMAIENLVTRWVLDAPDIDRERLLDELVDLVTGYLEPAAPTQPPQMSPTVKPVGNGSVGSRT